jgi:sugar phosphate isomerase/epimerase
MNTDIALKKIGYKIVDRRRDETEPLLLDALGSQRPLEIGIYYHDPSTHDLLDNLLPQSKLELNTHLDHRHLNLFALNDEEVLDRLKRQIETSLQWGAEYGINHVSAFTLSRRIEYQDALFEKLIDHLRVLNRVCREYQFPIYLENTYQEISFYQRLFSEIALHDLKHIHFCFDFGHAKVWSERPLLAWLELLRELQQRGRDLHFHLHTNRGISDEHLSFVEADWMDITGIEEYTAPWNSFEAISAMDEYFPAARKVMEVPTSEAKENLQHVIDAVNQVRKRQQPISA